MAVPEEEKTLAVLKDEERAELIAVKDIERIRSPHFLTVSSNNANLTRGFFDVSILFSEIVIVPGGKPQVFIEDRAAVEMSWEHAKALHKVLGSTIEFYEAKYGKIRDQPEKPEISA